MDFLISYLFWHVIVLIIFILIDLVLSPFDLLFDLFDVLLDFLERLLGSRVAVFFMCVYTCFLIYTAFIFQLTFQFYIYIFLLLALLGSIWNHSYVKKMEKVNKKIIDSITIKQEKKYLYQETTFVVIFALILAYFMPFKEILKIFS